MVAVREYRALALSVHVVEADGAGFFGEVGGDFLVHFDDVVGVVGRFLRRVAGVDDSNDG